MIESILLAFSAGMVAAINPCGFALLPAYLAYYLGLEATPGEDAAPATASLGRSLAVGGAMTLGVMVVFGSIGAVWSAVSEAVGERLPWVIVVLGVLLVALGIAMIAGFSPVLRIPKLATTSGAQSTWSALLFGVSYGVASLSCTIGPFIGTVVTTFRRHDFLSGVGTFVAYGVGMGAIIVVLTVAIGFARQGVVHRLRRLVPHMGRISGVLLVLTGAVAAYYGWYEAEVLTGGAPEGGFAATISGWRDDLSGWIQDVGEERIGIAVAVLVAGAAAVAVISRRRPPSEDLRDSSVDA